jgi:hypothetical protein
MTERIMINIYLTNKQVVFLKMENYVKLIKFEDLGNLPK